MKILVVYLKVVYLSSVISLKFQWRPINCHLSEITELIYNLDNYHSRRKFQMAL